MCLRVAQSSPAPRSAVGPTVDRGAGELWARDWFSLGFLER